MTQVRRAALRVAEELVKAKQGAYYRHGWASYLHRSDVETLLLSCLNDTEKAVYLKAVSEATSGP